MQDTSVVFVMVTFYLLIITHSHADYAITECSTDRYINVREDTVTIITCTGMESGHNIYWALSERRIGDCTANLQCQLTDDKSASDYNLTRPTTTQSDLRIQGNYRSKAEQIITCSQRLNQTQVYCKVNIIYPGHPTLPSLTKDYATRTVRGSYFLDKIYSSRNIYSCVWIMENETQHEIKRERVDPDLSTFRELEEEFYNGTCSFSWPLPTEEGRYSINLIVVPGEADKSYSAGTFVIDKYTIPGCSSDGNIDVREDTGTTITCDGIQGSAYNIYWALSGNRIGDCGFPKNFDSCWLNDPGNTDYNLTRPSASRSELRILGNFRSKAGENITCSRRDNSTQVSCKINIIYPGQPTDPSLNIDGGTWTVNGSFRVEKMYSSRNQYICIWTQKNKTQHEIQTQSVAPDPSILHESDQEFYNWTCSFSWPLPTEDGLYSISLTVVPGEADKSYSAGTVVIEHPGDPAIHCDAGPVVEKSDVTCQCSPSSTKAGSPAPSLSWPGFSDSSQLRLTNIGRADNGTQYTCQLTWGPNANIVKTANYTLHLDIFSDKHEAASEIQQYPDAAVGGGVGAFIAVVIVAAVVAIVIFKRKRQFEEHINIVYGMGDELEEPKQQSISTPEPVAEAFRNPLGNTTTEKTRDEATTDKDVTEPEADAGYYSIADYLPSVQYTEGGDQYQNTQKVLAGNQTPGKAASKDSQHTVNTHGAKFPNFGSKDAELGNAVTSQEDVYAVVDKTKKSPTQCNDVSPPNSSKPKSDRGPRGIVHAQVSSTSDPRDADFASTMELHDTEKHQVAMADKLAVSAYPTVKEKHGQQQQTAVSEEDVPSSWATENSNQTINGQENVYANGQSSSAAPSNGSEHVEHMDDNWYANFGSKDADLGNVGTLQDTVCSLVDKTKKTQQQRNDVSPPNSTDPSNYQGPRAPTGAGERIRTQDTRAAGQNYENVGDALASTPLQFQPDSKETTSGDEYSTLSWLNPHGARQKELDSEYSHLSHL